MMAIAEKQTAREAWEAIREMRVDEDRVKKARVQILKRSFDRLIMEDSESICEFSQKHTTMVGEIRSLDTEVKESVVVEKLFSAVPDRFLQIVSTIEQWGDMSMMSLSEAIRRLRVYEESIKGRRTERGEKEKEQLMLTRAQWESLAIKEKKIGKGSNRGTKKHGWRGGGRGRSRGQGGGRGDDSDKKPHKKTDKTKIRCFKYGHYASECPQPKRARVNFAQKQADEEPALLMAETCEIVQTTGDLTKMVMLNEEQVWPNLESDKERIDCGWYLDTQELCDIATAPVCVTREGQADRQTKRT